MQARLTNISGKIVDRLSDLIADKVAESISAKIAQDVSASVMARLARTANIPDLVDMITSSLVPEVTSTMSSNLTSEDTKNKASGAPSPPRPEGPPKEFQVLQKPSYPNLAPPLCSDRQLRSSTRKRHSPDPLRGRTPKRRASQSSDIGAGDDHYDTFILEDSLKPLRLADIDAWGGWAELESEPTFFNAILHQLGVRHARVKELFSYEPWALEMLPQPIYGLIFLFQYAPLESDDNPANDEKPPIWFANQTDCNSCASVAMLNIIMNVDEIELGDRLRAFKEKTLNLNAPLRGYHIGSSRFIKTAHNSFLRRMDQLHVDHCLAYEFADAAIRGSASGLENCGEPEGNQHSTPLTSKQRKHKKPKVEYGLHFIAYVPAAGSVWEVDGMRRQPLKIGKLSGTDWTSLAAPRIQERIHRYEASENNFNLLAICRDQRCVIKDGIRSKLIDLRHLYDHVKSAGWATDDVTGAESPRLTIGTLLEAGTIGLTPAEISGGVASEELKTLVSADDFDAQTASELRRTLINEIKSAESKYREELSNAVEEDERVNRRKKNYMPALHHWLKKLAEKDVLEKLIKSSE